MSQNLQVIESIVHLTAKRALSVEDVCHKAKLTGRQFQAAVEEAAKRGYSIRVREGMVSSLTSVRAEATITLGAKKPGRYVVAHWSDTHFGCRHTAEADITSFLTRAYERGARVAVHTGDLLDGNRSVLLADQDYVGFDSQFDRALRTVKACPPMQHIAIDGNHDGYYSSAMGTASGRIVAAQMRDAGVDWQFAGVCLGCAEIHGADWQLWHPAGGSQSKMGVIKVMQDRVEEQPDHIDVLGMGHLHKFVSAVTLDTLLVAPGTYQRQKSEFASRISTPWNIGGAIVSYELGKDGRIHDKAAEFVPARAG